MAATAAKTKRADGGTIRVRATAVGFYADIRWRVGDVFTLYPRRGRFTQLVKDEKTGKPLLNEEALVKHRITEEPEEDVLLTAEQQFNKKWMERVPADTPEQAKSAQQVIQEEHDRVLATRLAGGTAASDRPSGDDDVI